MDELLACFVTLVVIGYIIRNAIRAEKAKGSHMDIVDSFKDEKWSAFKDAFK